MNREFKRRMRREQQQHERAMSRGQQRAPIPVQQRRERLRIRQYFSEIRSELRRVIWPTRSEVVTYSIVVVFVVSIITGVVFVLDLGFGQALLRLFSPTGR